MAERRESGRWRALASSRKARNATIALVAAQLAVTALEMLSPRPVAEPILCPLSWDVYDAGVETACVATLLLFLVSAVAGLLALRFAALRPVYWALLLLLPVGIGGQVLLMHALGLHGYSVHHG